MKAVVQIAGEWTTTCQIEDGIDAGWYLLYAEGTDDEPAFIYHSNPGYLVRGNGEEVAYGTYNIDWI
jgi:hypothetical protein